MIEFRRNEMTCRSCATAHRVDYIPLPYPGECPDCDRSNLESATSNRVINSIIAMRTVDPDYWNKTLESRLKGGAGSYFNQYETVEELAEALAMASWLPYSHQGVSADAEAFITNDIGGVIGVTPIMHGEMYRLTDPKVTGKASAVAVSAPACEQCTVGFTVLIAGVEDGELRAFTVHPGSPIKASQVSTLLLEDRMYSGEECLGMGLTHAKIQR